MVELVLPNLYRIEIPLPDSPLKSLNSYVIIAAERNLIVDTGFNREECLAAMEAGLDELKIDLEKTDLYITHLHADHFGLVSELVRDGCNVFFNRPDAEIIWAWDGFEPFVQYAVKNGCPEEEFREAIENHPATKYDAKLIPEMNILKDGDTIEIGNFRFECIATPGHTQGHMCLYESQKKIFISGDHILGDITPNIQCWSDELNPLENYLASLDKVYDLDVDSVLPGHRRLFTNFKERIDELKSHHQTRAEEALSVLRQGPKTAYQVAPGMTWDIVCDSWEQFPPMQKWFATGETIAHLRYLEERGKISKKIEENLCVYSLNSS